MFGKMQSLGSLKSFLWYAPQLSGTSILCFFTLSLLKVHHQGWLQRPTAWWWASCLHPEFPQGSPLGQLWCDGLMAATSCVYWYGRQYSSFTVIRVYTGGLGLSSNHIFLIWCPFPTTRRWMHHGLFRSRDVPVKQSALDPATCKLIWYQGVLGIRHLQWWTQESSGQTGWTLDCAHTHLFANGKGFKLLISI